MHLALAKRTVDKVVYLQNWRNSQITYFIFFLPSVIEARKTKIYFESVTEQDMIWISIFIDFTMGKKSNLDSLSMYEPSKSSDLCRLSKHDFLKICYQALFSSILTTFGTIYLNMYAWNKFKAYAKQEGQTSWQDKRCYTTTT